MEKLEHEYSRITHSISFVDGLLLFERYIGGGKIAFRCRRMVEYKFRFSERTHTSGLHVPVGHISYSVFVLHFKFTVEQNNRIQKEKRRFGYHVRRFAHTVRVKQNAGEHVLCICRPIHLFPLQSLHEPAKREACGYVFYHIDTLLHCQGLSAFVRMKVFARNKNVVRDYVAFMQAKQTCICNHIDGNS